MAIVERNDIDIDKLFRWGDKFTINWIQGKTLDVYIRLVGDAEFNQCRVFGLRQSNKMRESFTDFNSDNRLAFIPHYSTVKVDNLIYAIILASKEEFTTEGITEIKIPVPKELNSEATLEEQEQYQKEVDEYPKTREKAILEFINNKVTEKQKELSKLSKRQLYDMYTEVHINEACQTEFLRAFRTRCAWYGTYKDENYTQRLYENFEEFDNLPSNVKQQLVEKYVSLELSMESLKA